MLDFAWFTLLPAVICFILGVCCGLRNVNSPNGSFILNRSDPSKDLCQLYLDVDLDYIEQHDYLLLKIRKV